MDDHLLRGFVQQHSLEFAAFGSEIRLSGNIACKGRVVIMVVKHLAVLDDGSDPRVRTRKYAYNAFIPEVGTILRHDNCHAHVGHSDEHHWHEFDLATRAEVEGSPFWCGAKGWPNLSQFIDKVAEWYDAHRDELPDPEAVVDDLSVYDERTAVYE